MPHRHQSSSSSSSDAQSSSSQQINFTTIIVTNLTTTVTEDHLKQIFSNFGQIQSLGIRESQSSQSKENQDPTNRHAMINYSQQKDAQTAVEYMDDGWVDGLKIRVKMDTGNSNENAIKKEDYIDNDKGDNRKKYQDVPLGKSNNSIQEQKQVRKEDDSLSEIQPKKKDRSSKKEIRKQSRSRKQDRPKHGNNRRKYRSRSRSSNRKGKKIQTSKGRRDRSDSRSSRRRSSSDRSSKNRKRKYSSSSGSSSS